jgi:D-galactarolactone cycloisomerase
VKIEQVDLWHVAIPLRTPFYPSWIPGFPQTDVRFTLVRLRTKSGLEGFSAGPAMGKERAGLGSLLGPYILDERADDIPSIRQRIREMGYLGMRIGWLEAACWDIVGKARQKPVYELLGGRAGSVRVYCSTGQIACPVAEIQQRFTEGFDAVKIRVHAMTLDEDLARLREVREAVGDKARLGVDANQAWRVAAVGEAPLWKFERALLFCREAERLGYEWVEEPLAMDDYEGLARLCREVKIDISGGELNSQGLPEFGVMLEKGCYDVYQPDAVFTGGIAETWRIIQKVKAAGARYSPHTWTNGVGFAMNLQLHAASPFREKLLEFPQDGSWVPEARDGILREPFLAKGGALSLPTAPGLGFEIDARALTRHASHFHRSTKFRLALGAIWDKGLSAAKEAGSVRSSRLAARSSELEAKAARGEDVALESLAP